MPDFFEVDFLDVETKKSGDAIPLRYESAASDLFTLWTADSRP
jgi:hypothetical protein